MVGGQGKEVEMDETELGRKPKGLHGHKKDVKSDVVGIYDRSTGINELEHSTRRRLVMTLNVGSYLHVMNTYRVWQGTTLPLGPSYSLMVPKPMQKLRKKKDGSMLTLITTGEFIRHQRTGGKLREISTQRIDGAWGNFKTWYKARYGASPDNAWAF